MASTRARAWLGVWLLAASPASGGELDAAAVLDRLQEWLDGTTTLESRFEQTLVSGALGGGLSERGRLYLERPGRMRFDYNEPEKKVAIVDGERTWLYLAADRQLLLGRLDGEGELLPALLAGRRPLDEIFDATVEGSVPVVQGRYRLALRPRGSTDAVERVVVTLRAPLFAIDAAEILDAAGNRMDYTFTGQRRNVGLPRGAFGFAPPAGTEVSGSHEETVDPGVESRETGW